MRLHELAPAEGSKKARKRLGRGVASGTGKTAGRGSKGHGSRSGGGVRPGFEGGQMPIHRRLPKRGFTNIFKKIYEIVNVRDLNRFESGMVVDAAALADKGLIKHGAGPVKLLGQGEVAIDVSVRLAAVSTGAKEKIIAAGGKVEVI